MGFLLEFGLILLLVGGIATYAMRGARNRGVDQREAITARRVEAYIQTIRRERRNPDLVAMSDTELTDLLLSSARNLKIESERKLYVLAAVAFVTVLSAIVVASQNGTTGFGITLLVGAIVVYGLNEYLSRRMREPLLARGIDVERLKVE
jgi:hypothetical protein